MNTPEEAAVAREFNRFDLSGSVAVVTGAGQGLGRDLAIGLAGAGADIALVGGTSSTLAQVAAELAPTGRQISTHIADVTDVTAGGPLVEAVLSAHGRLDILINNAGTKVVQTVEDVTEDAWDRVMNLNLKGTFFLAQAAARPMVEQGYGKIVNIASTYAVVGSTGRTTYAISKGGLLQLTRSMAVELAPRGVNVNAVGPTSIETPMNEDLFADPAWREMALNRIPAGRFCTPDDVVGPVIFLAGRASDMVHGQLLLVDGGLTAL